MPKTEIVRDAAIQRFEYNFELAWKTVKKFAEKQGIESNSPREAFKAAFRLKLILEENVWLDMLDDRNRTSHTYNENTADEIFGNLKKYEQAMCALLERIKAAK
jgi:nucleotidyltransferase substrate binding protein (TIGR01987 family)